MLFRSSQPLQVSGGAYVSGNVGIATTNPLQKLHVLGNLLVAAGSSTGQHITQKAYELNSGTLSWEGSAGQLFSITNNLTSGSIFSVNDVSGIPSIDVNADGTIQLAPYGVNEKVGIGTTLPLAKLHIQGDVCRWFLPIDGDQIGCLQSHRMVGARCDGVVLRRPNRRWDSISQKPSSRG